LSILLKPSLFLGCGPGNHLDARLSLLVRGDRVDPLPDLGVFRRDSLLFRGLFVLMAALLDILVLALLALAELAAFESCLEALTIFFLAVGFFAIAASGMLVVLYFGFESLLVPLEQVHDGGAPFFFIGISVVAAHTVAAITSLIDPEAVAVKFEALGSFAVADDLLDSLFIVVGGEVQVFAFGLWDGRCWGRRPFWGVVLVFWVFLDFVGRLVGIRVPFWAFGVFLEAAGGSGEIFFLFLDSIAIEFFGEEGLFEVYYFLDHPLAVAEFGVGQRGLDHFQVGLGIGGN
jgi:hypothetical protein